MESTCPRSGWRGLGRTSRRSVRRLYPYRPWSQEVTHSHDRLQGLLVVASRLHLIAMAVLRCTLGDKAKVALHELMTHQQRAEDPSYEAPPGPKAPGGARRDRESTAR